MKLVPLLLVHRGFWLLALLLSCRGVLGAADQAPIDDRLIVDDTKINGQPVRVAFDTGAEFTVIFRPAAERLGLKVSDPPAGTRAEPGKTLLGSTNPVQLQYGTKVVTLPFSVMEVPTGLSWGIDGLFGWDVLPSEYFITFIPGVKLDIAATGEVPGPTAAWQQLSLRKNSKVLVLEVPDTNGTSIGVAIDTGDSDGVSLSPAKWRQWRAEHPAAPTTINAYFRPGAGLVVREVSWAKELTLGPLTLTDVAVQENDIANQAAGANIGATLGLAAIKRQTLLVDGKLGMAYFARQQFPAQAFEHNRLGAVFTPSDLQHDPLEAHVVAGSPAEEAGIRNGDVLLKIDALDATKWRTDPAVMPMGRFWQRPAGTSIVLTTQRGDKVLTVPVTLRDLIGPGVDQTKVASPSVTKP